LTTESFLWPGGPGELANAETPIRRSVPPPGQYEGFIRLLEIFGRQLSALANRMMLQDAEAESPMIRRAKAYIADHHGDSIGLDEVANAMHVSIFYFCRVFRKAVGLTFTDYLGRVRVEEAKTLLLNPHLRVSEIAYAVGFQSLTHFNRVFRQLTGESPTRFRANGASRAKGMARNLIARISAPEDVAAGTMRLTA
jgi:AraC-like DNA-binding protein